MQRYILAASCVAIIGALLVWMVSTKGPPTEPLLSQASANGTASNPPSTVEFQKAATTTHAQSASPEVGPGPVALFSEVPAFDHDYYRARVLGDQYVNGAAFIAVSRRVVLVHQTAINGLFDSAAESAELVRLLSEDAATNGERFDINLHAQTNQARASTAKPLSASFDFTLDSQTPCTVDSYRDYIVSEEADLVFAKCSNYDDMRVNTVTVSRTDARTVVTVSYGKKSYHLRTLGIRNFALVYEVDMQNLGLREGTLP